MPYWAIRLTADCIEAELEEKKLEASHLAVVQAIMRMLLQGLLLELHSLQQRRHELDVASEGVTAASAAGSSPLSRGPSRGPRSGATGISDWQRVEELYDICERWKAPSAVLPSVLHRLKLLKGIHQEAGGMAVRLSGRFRCGRVL